MSQDDLAAALGKSKGLISRYKQRGMPVHDVEAARRWCDANVQARQAAMPQVSSGRQDRAPPMPTPPPTANPIEAVSADDYPLWRARREAMAAQQAEIEVAKMRGELVEAAKVRAEFAKALATIRDGMLGIAGRLAPVLAAEYEVRVVQATLDREIRAAIGAVVGA